MVSDVPFRLLRPPCHTSAHHANPASTPTRPMRGAMEAFPPSTEYRS